ncbi:uncharacterized protein HMPREF1541_02228 [Cyphellophora europaea CBS 101466]|uniref:Uncharacterized protein n=1 Tax=Cyphellophora europaea (strain CBS 101466) TaxID=1220924 RepID=W2S385_CYPE1|nr:uncharacterized protein HMPREF1541_02228 [Cyphellophora europaea CBS 101466]ETN43070.1 hypothetical protein HMPREF1541_02228 [Cyphellophora europaea CBS 101466]
MSLRFLNGIPLDQPLRQPKSSESFQSSASRKHTLETHKREVGNVPTLYNIDTKEPLPVRNQEQEWSLSSTSPASPVQRLQSRHYKNLPLWWTVLLAVVPILAFTTAFFGIVIADRAKTDQTSPFDNKTSSWDDRANVLVNRSATQLVFLAGFSSTLAPMLLGSLMTLWHYPTARHLFELSQRGNPKKLPTPQQLSILVGLSAGSVDELRRYIIYRCRRFRAAEAAILSRSALVLFLSIVLAGLVLLADIGVHNFTSTVAIRLSTLESHPSGSYGRGLASHCIDFDRSRNQGLPCTVVADASVGANAVAFDSGEIISMQANHSKVNSAWQIKDDMEPRQDLVLLMPQTETLESGRDFTASTIGVATQCSPLTQRCVVRVTAGLDSNETYVLFNCTQDFRGALGAPESVAKDTATWTRTDDTTPDFNFKLDRNFQYAYFADSDLNEPYNSIGGTPGLNTDSTGEGALPENSLLRRYHLAVAGLVPVQRNADGRNLLSDPAALAIGDSLIAYTLNCSVTAYEVNYTWFGNNIQELSRVETTNGSILELAHGMQASGMPSLSQAQSMASLTSSMSAFARTYANLHSQDTVALIASAMSPRGNLQEATTIDMLVAKVPLWSLVALLASNLAFIIFASVLAARALLHNSPETRDMVAKLSVEGLTATAFEDRNGKQDPGPIVTDADDMFEESRIGMASRRVALRRATGGTMALRIEQPNL